MNGHEARHDAQLEDHARKDAPKVFGIAATARAWDVSTRTVARWLTDGLPFFQQGPGCKILIKPEDVEGFLRRHVTTTDLTSIVNEVADEVLRGLPPQPRHSRQPRRGNRIRTSDKELTDVR